MSDQQRIYQESDCVYFWKTKDPFGELSNMSAIPITLNSYQFKTVEHAYQCLKFQEETTQKEICSVNSPIEAKKIAQKYKNQRDDWDEIRVKLMSWLLAVKTIQNWDRIISVLNDTGDKSIVEYSTKSDFWGAFYENRVFTGTNCLGRLWMYVREAIKNNTLKPNMGLKIPNINGLFLFSNPLEDVLPSNTLTYTLSQ